MGRHLKEVWLLTAVLGLIAGVLLFLGIERAWWALIAPALSGLYALTVVPLTGVRIYNARHSSVKAIELKFREEGIYMLSFVEQSLIRYEDVLELMQEENYLMIRLRHHTPLVFERAQIGDGREAELMNFLKEKTEREFRSVHL